MILDRQALSMCDVKELLESVPDSEKKEKTEEFIKKFSKIKLDKAKKIREALERLDLLKIKEEHIVKIIDISPEDASDLNKIFTDASLTEDETNKILDIVKG